MNKLGLIHIIDDESIIHEVLGELFISEGYQIESSFSGEEALKKHKPGAFDLTLLDLLMPGIDGIKTLKDTRMASKKTYYARVKY